MFIRSFSMFLTVVHIYKYSAQEVSRIADSTGVWKMGQGPSHEDTTHPRSYKDIYRDWSACPSAHFCDSRNESRVCKDQGFISQSY